MEITNNNEEERRMRDLYKAAQEGRVSTLNTLLQQDPLILHRLSSQTTFFETPLHVSTLLGHLEFTRTLLARCPKLALESDSSQRTPLHLASARGHMHTVKELLQAGGEACLVHDQEHRIPLHHAVMRGRRDVVLELITASPESLRLHDDKGKTIFHLCVMYNRLDILKDLVKLDTDGTHELLIKGDLDGKNTVLHLAIMLKQVETVSYLISIQTIISEALNLKNDMGYTATDIVERSPKDSKSLEIQVILMDRGIKSRRKERIDGVASQEERCRKEKWSWRYVLETIDQWLVYNGDWLEDMRGNLSTVATVISTMTFQTVLSPRGIRPNDPLGCLPYKDESEHDKGSSGQCPGEAMLAYRQTHVFSLFIMYNTISFVTSLCVALLLVSGVPLKHRFVMWLLSIGMGISITYLTNAYAVGLVLITPDVHDIDQVMTISSWIFNALRALTVVYSMVIFVIWVVKKLKAKAGKQLSQVVQ
ncbi:ankyrin repeat-containing protein ITN1-like [Neltuma alba]|uniref:ankyrin repeat-containing protein ITN1-like n=1 Tax=Neltuma alba TaxID=207710 RepID=UPI0010A37BB0|nr:ankyrin repeat-containing protein ITN1-like [Prosopis alba]